MNMATAMNRTVEEIGEKLLMIFEGREITNTQLNEEARRLGSGLKSLGINRGDHVAVCMPNCPEVWAVFQGIWQAGAVIAPIMFRLSAEEIHYILQDSDARFIITSAELLNKIEEARKGIDQIKKIIVLEGEDKGDLIDFYGLMSRSEPKEKAEELDEEEVALMIYTSGTTGRPKGVMLTHGNLYFNFMATVGGPEKSQDLNRRTVSIVCLPLAHGFGVFLMNAALLSKKKQAYYVLMRWFDPKEVLSMIEKYRITHFSGVPAMYRMLLNHPDFNHYDLSSLESCSIASAPVTEELYKAFTTKFNCTMSEVYGLTEAVAVVTISRADMPRKQGSSGVPLPGVELRIVDAEDKELPPYEQGEITVKGPNVMKGYYKNPEETKEALRGGWLHTGDIGYVDEEGSLYVTDRKKDMIIKGGYNIYPSEIEKYILEHPVVREVGVVGVPHEKYGEDVFAFAVLKDGKKISERELIDYIQSRISKFKAPSRIEFVDDLPKNLVGKIQKQELKKMAKRIVS